jgi:hypothetical protein
MPRTDLGGRTRFPVLPQVSSYDLLDGISQPEHTRRLAVRSDGTSPSQHPLSSLIAPWWPVYRLLATRNLRSVRLAVPPLLTGSHHQGAFGADPGCGPIPVQSCRETLRPTSGSAFTFLCVLCSVSRCEACKSSTMACAIGHNPPSHTVPVEICTIHS